MPMGTFDTRKRGLNIFLGPLESEIMRGIWAGRKTTRSVWRFMRDEYTTPNSDEISYNSIASTMTRLAALGYIVKIGGDRHDGFVYAPAIATENEFIDRYINMVFDALIESYPRETVQTFVRRIKALQEG